MDEVRVLYFGALRDQLGLDEERLPLAGGSTVARVIDELQQRRPALAPWRDRLLVAVDLEYADADTPVRPGDELALMPPVQGG